MGRNKNSFSREKSTCHGTLDPVDLPFQSRSFFISLFFLAKTNLQTFSFWNVELGKLSFVEKFLALYWEWWLAEIWSWSDESRIKQQEIGKVGKGLHNACCMAGQNKCFVVFKLPLFLLIFNEKRMGHAWSGSTTITKCRFDLYLNLIQTFFKA